MRDREMDLRNGDRNSANVNSIRPHQWVIAVVSTVSALSLPRFHKRLVHAQLGQLGAGAYAGWL